MRGPARPAERPRLSLANCSAATPPAVATTPAFWIPPTDNGPDLGAQGFGAQDFGAQDFGA